MRIGHGYDVHAFREGDSIVLCGVSIPHSRAFKAHSDGDVALHALCDALLGAAALGDIGKHFPDTDEQYAGIDSRILLQQVIALIAQKNLVPVNLDITIVAQQPKLQPYIEAMCQVVADVIGISREQVNVKATTSERLGFTGREEGIAAHAVVLLESTG
ncbi:MAG: 2-C-methyl-D-erythritol 2,4-cyclodiphosphate synthase [Pseudomonadota bacterium]